MNKIKPEKFSFKNSLKEGPKYPILHYIRIERYFTRPLASVFVKLIYNTKITPNQITVFAFILGMLAAISYSFGSYQFIIAGGILLQLSSIFDCADGMLARSKDMCSRYGAFLDLFLDRIADFFVLWGITSGLYIQTGKMIWVIAGLAGTGLYSLQIILFYLVKVYKEDFNEGESAEARGFSIFGILILSILNQIQIILLMTIITAILNISMRIIIYKRLGEKDLSLTGCKSASDNGKQADTGIDQA